MKRRFRRPYQSFDRGRCFKPFFCSRNGFPDEDYVVQNAPMEFHDIMHTPATGGGLVLKAELPGNGTENQDSGGPWENQNESVCMPNTAIPIQSNNNFFQMVDSEQMMGNHQYNGFKNFCPFRPTYFNAPWKKGVFSPWINHSRQHRKYFPFKKKFFSPFFTPRRLNKWQTWQKQPFPFKSGSNMAKKQPVKHCGTVDSIFPESGNNRRDGSCNVLDNKWIKKEGMINGGRSTNLEDLKSPLSSSTSNILSHSPQVCSTEDDQELLLKSLSEAVLRKLEEESSIFDVHPPCSSVSCAICKLASDVVDFLSVFSCDEVDSSLLASGKGGARSSLEEKAGKKSDLPSTEQTTDEVPTSVAVPSSSNNTGCKSVAECTDATLPFFENLKRTGIALPRNRMSNPGALLKDPRIQSRLQRERLQETKNSNKATENKPKAIASGFMKYHPLRDPNCEMLTYSPASDFPRTNTSVAVSGQNVTSSTTTQSDVVSSTSQVSSCETKSNCDSVDTRANFNFLAKLTQSCDLWTCSRVSSNRLVSANNRNNTNGDLPPKDSVTQQPSRLKEPDSNSSHQGVPTSGTQNCSANTGHVTDSTNTNSLSTTPCRAVASTAFHLEISSEKQDKDQTLSSTEKVKSNKNSTLPSSDEGNKYRHTTHWRNGSSHEPTNKTKLFSSTNTAGCKGGPTLTAPLHNYPEVVSRSRQSLNLKEYFKSLDPTVSPFI